MMTTRPLTITSRWTTISPPSSKRSGIAPHQILQTSKRGHPSLQFWLRKTPISSQPPASWVSSCHRIPKGHHHHRRRRFAASIQCAAAITASFLSNLSPRSNYQLAHSIARHGQRPAHVLNVLKSPTSGLSFSSMEYG